MRRKKTILVVDDRINTLKVLMLFLADKGVPGIEGFRRPGKR